MFGATSDTTVQTRESEGVDDAGGGRRGLRPELSKMLVRTLTAEYDIEPVSPPIDLGGSSNLNLLIEAGRKRFVARVYRLSVTSARLNAIQVARSALVAAGVPAAAILLSRDAQPWIDIDNRLAEVETFVASDSQMNTWPSLLRGLPALGHVHSVLAGVDLPEDGIDPVFSNYLSVETTAAGAQQAADRIRTWGPTDDERAIAEMGDELASSLDLSAISSLPRQLVHGDYWDNNVLFRNQQLVLVTDLDFMGCRARVDDLALTLYFAALEPALGINADRAGATRLKQLVDAYNSGLDEPLTTEERAALPIALARQPLWSLGVWVAELDDNATARRHTTSLEPELEWGLAIAGNLENWRDALS